MNIAQLFKTPARELSSEDLKERFAHSCNFAFPGTYGHACGKRATLAASHPSTETKSGVFWSRRCPECAKIRGGENRGLSAFVPFDPVAHRNEWK